MLVSDKPDKDPFGLAENAPASFDGLQTVLSYRPAPSAQRPAHVICGACGVLKSVPRFATCLFRSAIPPLE